ncbi:unnamed protein product [Adineta ricciae]|uniref:G-protein coupled receptors family 1 profile domain-containing protein n=1 Tax=Adineta ricciae TaxID=249248 RepID=A0A815Q2U4_ADIRI|nr:unnamed protein product [Adineta ricciae]CAF1646692.1 unnamed protein product [Adineta ricciae]
MSSDLVYAGQQLTIYFGSFLIIMGVIGNGINILVFSTVRNYRQTPCTFYFLIGSIFNSIFILVNLTTRVAAGGFGIDLTRTSLIWCKIRSFSLMTVGLITFTCSCLATIDQFLITSKHASLRRLSHITFTHRIAMIIILFWCIHGIPALLFNNISSITNSCVVTNATFAVYFAIYQIGLNCIIPISVMSIFGYLAYHNIHTTIGLAEQQADRQLLKMVLLQSVLISPYLPFGINYTYSLMTAGIKKDADRLYKEGFAVTIFNLTNYLFFTGSCYIFLISSSRFRRAAKNRLFFWQNKNQIAPLTHNTLTQLRQ